MNKETKMNKDALIITLFLFVEMLLNYSVITVNISDSKLISITNIIHGMYIIFWTFFLAVDKKYTRESRLSSPYTYGSILLFLFATVFYFRTQSQNFPVLLMCSLVFAQLSTIIFILLMRKLNP